MHHVCFAVDDIAAELRRIAAGIARQPRAPQAVDDER
jgi:hypothetical protein